MWLDLKITQLPHSQYETYDFTIRKWITGSIHYHIPLSALLQSCKSGSCGSFSQTLCKPREARLWHHYLVMALLYWCLDGWVSHEWLANVFHLQFWMLWTQARSTRTPNWTSGFQLSSYSILYFYRGLLNPPPTPIHSPTTPITTSCNTIILTKKATQNSLNFGCLKVIHPHNYD